MQVTDAHTHFWDLDKLSYPWLESVPEINHSFGLQDYEKVTAGIPITTAIFVQCECLPEQYMEEVRYVSGLAKQDTRIRAIVAYFPLDAPDAEEQLQNLLSNPLVKGIRRLEEQPASLYENPAFMARMGLLADNDLSFDLCLNARQLPAAVKLMQAAPDIRYMLDHCGKPDIRRGEHRTWTSHIRRLAENPNVYCKLSGLVTEADPDKWTSGDLLPYVDTVLEYFGTDRVVFGGDWPVVTLASGYSRWYHTARELCRALSADDQDKLFRTNALVFYRIINSHFLSKG